MLKLNKKTVVLTKKIIVIYLLLIPLIYLTLTNFQLYWYNTDLCQDYISAKNLISGKSIYLPNDCWGYRIIPLKFNPHPPFAVFPFIVLTPLPQGIANIVWGFISAGLYVLSLFLILLILKVFSFPRLAILLTFSIFWDPLRNSTINQNTSQLTLILLTTVWYLDLRKKSYLSGILLGIASLLRLWPAVYLISAIIFKRLKLTTTALVTVLSGILLTILINKPYEYLFYFKTVLKEENLQVLNPDNISLISLIAKLMLNSGLSVHNSIELGKIAGLITYTILACLVYLIAKNSLKKQSVYILTQSISLNMLIFVFPIYWGWGLLIYVLIYAMVLYVHKRQANMPQYWTIVFLTSISILFLLKVFVPRYLTNDPKLSIVEYMKIVDIHTIVSLLGAVSLLFCQLVLLKKICNE